MTAQPHPTPPPSLPLRIVTVAVSGILVGLASVVLAVSEIVGCAIVGGIVSQTPTTTTLPAACHVYTCVYVP